MEKVVYILGAGFSAPLGLPVMSNFVEKSKDMYFEDTEEYKDFKQIFEIFSNLANLKNYYDADLLNIEEVLSIVETKQLLGHVDIRAEVINYIKCVLNYHMPEFSQNGLKNNLHKWYNHLFVQNDPGNCVNVYGKFFSSLLNSQFIRHDSPLKYDFNFIEKEKEYSVITLNYDLILESYKDYINKHYRYFDKHKIEFNTEPNNDLNFNVLSLAKLHGSVDGKIIPPTWNKIIRNQEIKKNWILAYNLLKQASHIRFIGYSLPISDAYVKYLFKSSLTDDPDLTHLKKIDVICYDPDGLVYERYNSFITYNNFRFVNSKFEGFLSSIETKIDNDVPKDFPDNYSWQDFEYYYEEEVEKRKK